MSVPVSSRESRAIESLQPHPRQADLWGQLPEPELAALADDIDRGGLREAVLITQSGIICDGHQRVEACRRLGHSEIPVVIVDDDEAAEIHLSANLRRRQLGPVAKARALKLLAEHRRLQEIRQLKPETQNVDLTESPQLREKLAAELGCSSRTVYRHLLLLRTPRSVQDAVDRGELGLVLALKLLSLPDQLDTVSARISAGESPKLVVREAIATTVEPEPEDAVEVADVEADDTFDDDPAAGVYHWLICVIDEWPAESLVGSGPLEYAELLPALEAGVELFRRMLELEAEAQRSALQEGDE